jgi:hypothetical protein
VVPIVAMRPPPEIAAQLNLPVSALPVEIAYPPAGSHTQPFVTGSPQAIPAGTRTQPMQVSAQHATHVSSLPVSGRSGAGQRRPQPPAPSKSPLVPILTILVLLSMIGTGVYIFLNKDKLFKSETKQEESTEIKSASDLMNKIKNTGKK